MSDPQEDFTKMLEESRKPRYCIPCGKELGKIGFGGGGSPFDFFGLSGNQAFYCKNNKCKHFGLLTLGCRGDKKK